MLNRSSKPSARNVPTQIAAESVSHDLVGGVSGSTAIRMPAESNSNERWIIR